jgi:hypothetical protein
VILRDADPAQVAIAKRRDQAQFLQGSEAEVVPKSVTAGAGLRSFFT